MASMTRQFTIVGLRAVALALCWAISGHAAHLNRARALAFDSLNTSSGWGYSSLGLPGDEPLPNYIPTAYPPSDTAGVIQKIDLHHYLETYDVVRNGAKNEKAIDVAGDISQWSCDKLTEYLEKLQRRYKRIKLDAGYAQYSASKENARLVVNEVVTDEQLVIDKHFDADKLSEELHLVVMETLRATEKFGLKCGATDEACFDYGTELISNFAKLKPMKKEVEGLVNEAGWLSGEAERRLASKEQKETAKLRKEAAFRKAKELWEFEKSVTANVMVKAAACGTRPPMGPWGTPSDGCNLKPTDPIMKALLTDDPAEFIRRWRAEISETAGIEEEYIHVDISQCLGKHGRPTLPPGWKP